MGSLSSMHKCLIALVVLSFIQAGGLPKAAEVQPLRGTPPGRPPGWRLRIVRWVETQRQLWSEQRLNSNQLRYMALLGLFFPCSQAANQSVLSKRRLWHICTCPFVHCTSHAQCRPLGDVLMSISFKKHFLDLLQQPALHTRSR